MPETATIQILMDGSDEERALMDELKEYIDGELVDELAKRGQLKPEFANNISECTDTSKLYVLPDGYIYAYMTTTVYVENNEYNPDTASFNVRLNSNAANAAQNGCLATDYIAVDYDKNEIVTIKGIEKLVSNYNAYFTIDYYDSNKAKVRNQVADYHFYADTSKITLPMSIKIFDPPQNSGISATLTNTKYVRIRLGIADNTVSINSSYCEGLVINFSSKNKTETVEQWANTGRAFVPADYEDRIVSLEGKSRNYEERITLLESSVTESGTVSIPTFWEDSVNTCIAKIKALQVGRNCVTFPFFSDNHQRNGYSGVLIAKIMKECHIPYAFYGGDSISSGYIATEEVMIAQDKAFDEAMSYIPNGRFCRAVGNHDGWWQVSAGEQHSYTDNQIYELFMREESIAQNKHFGGDGTYYYVNDIASKVRWIVLDTNDGVVEAEQITWLQNTALSFSESGWAVVFISHQPISNHYHANISNAEAVRTVVKNYINGTATNKADIVGWFSGHIHRDRIYTGAAVNTTDDSEGAEMPFKQVTITSDHTGIAYDTATKHTVANDDKSHAIDFVTINKTTRTVNLTRLGIGEDRSYTY